MTAPRILDISTPIDAQIMRLVSLMREVTADIETIDPESPVYRQMRKIVSEGPDNAIEFGASVKVKFFSMLCRNEARRRGLYKLPEGWREGWEGGICTSEDPLKGGIIDRNHQTEKWFLIPNDERFGPVEGFLTRSDALQFVQELAKRVAEIDKEEGNG